MNIKSCDFYYALRTLSFVEAIWLYGSRRSNDAIDTADIDLAIICPKASAEDWQRVLQIITDADTLCKIDIVRLDQLSTKTRLYENILKNHTILFERKENNYKWYESFLELGEALDQLKEMVLEPETAKSYVRDATIQRFEFCIELFWKTLEKICIAEQFHPTFHKQVLQNVFEMELIQDNHIWQAMINDRNFMAHVF